MSKPRSNVGIGVIDGVMYAVGGIQDLPEYSRSVEAYRPSVGVWTPMADMFFENYSSNYNIYIFKEYICKNIKYYIFLI